MTAPSSQTLQRLANATGLQAGTLKKVLRLLDVLQEIARDPVLADRLVLKGAGRCTSSTWRWTGCRSTSTSTMSARWTARRWRLIGPRSTRP